MSEGSFGSIPTTLGMIGALDALSHAPLHLKLMKPDELALVMPNVTIVNSKGVIRAAGEWGHTFDQALNALFRKLTNLSDADEHIAVNIGAPTNETRYFRWNGFAFKETPGPLSVQEQRASA